MLTRASAAIVVVASAVLAGCCSPYGCAKAKEGRALLQPLVEAVAAYENAEGAYPDSVSVLVPAYLAALPEAPVWSGASDGEWWVYSKTATGAEVVFSYFGPGANVCYWSSARTRWGCAGHH